MYCKHCDRFRSPNAVPLWLREPAALNPAFPALTCVSPWTDKTTPVAGAGTASTDKGPVTTLATLYFVDQQTTAVMALGSWTAEARFRLTVAIGIGDESEAMVRPVS
ncbi:hypothetical protein EDC14_10066 [Hydrogenispora ethanolica]|uniref:Uncharacterized protein n=1 Tax=Hydrogenispora ethanolica TaxID=1082276 RepID=A0A4R1RZQ7_HYDET|nr:hypothetical protein [Hydrogenispora ethanolica]TCL72298.1 hypothetical protein EDC14_10066 [Hydrogenispora ethanolica]